MFRRDESSNDDSAAPTPRVVAIMARNEVIELWHIYLRRTDYREQDIEVGKEVRVRDVDGRRQRREVHQRQIERQPWGHFVIHRYQATRMLPWGPSLGLAMLIPGTLLAAGSAKQGIMQVPLGLLIIQTALITLGGFMALSSGWRIVSRRLQSNEGLPLETLGVSGHALGFPAATFASEPAPGGYRAGRLRGQLEVDAAMGEWEVVQKYEDQGWWRQPI
jgi:hypothetical protein